MRGPKAGLKLTILPSCLGVTVLGRPPLLEETPSIIAVEESEESDDESSAAAADRTVEGSPALGGSGWRLSLRTNLQMH